jgi:Polyketide cyclase / dehydrase and lipid transport
MKWLIYTGLAVVIIPAIVILIGAALPKEHVASRKILVPASPGDVFALIAGPSDWRGIKYTLLTESPLKWRETDSSGQAITYERVETAAPTRIVNRIADPKLPFGGSWTYQIAPDGSGAELTITENGEVYSPLFRFVSRFIMGHTATIEKYQRDLAAHFSTAPRP